MIDFFFFNDTATTEIYTLSLHDALPICGWNHGMLADKGGRILFVAGQIVPRSEEHTSELQSRLHLVCRLLLEKKKKKSHSPLQYNNHHTYGHTKAKHHMQSRE